MQFPQSQCCNNSYLPPYNGSYSGCGNQYPIVPGGNPALQTWNGQAFVVADGSAQNPISLPFLKTTQGGAAYFLGADNNGNWSYYNPTNVTNANNLEVTATGSTTPRTLANRFADVVNVLDFGAVGNGVADDAAAFNLAIASGKPVYVPKGTYKTDGPVTATRRIVSSGATFTGTNSVDPYPAFGEGAFKVYATGNNNCIIGIVDNNNPPATFGFPTGVTGYGRNLNAGNTAFGIYAEARQYSNTGVATNEIDSFNHGSAPSTNLPPDRSIGTLQQHPIALTVAAGGDFNSSIGIDICQEGSSPRSFLTGIYLRPDACVNYGIFIDATSIQGPTEALIVKHKSSSTGIRINAIGSSAVDNGVLIVSNTAGTEAFSVKQDGRLAFPTVITQSTRGAAGAAQVLPSNPNGYLKVIIGGFVNLIPYYAA